MVQREQLVLLVILEQQDILVILVRQVLDLLEQLERLVLDLLEQLERLVLDLQDLQEFKVKQGHLEDLCFIWTQQEAHIREHPSREQ